jgi:hypothetical protein
MELRLPLDLMLRCVLKRLQRAEARVLVSGEAVGDVSFDLFDTLPQKAGCSAVGLRECHPLPALGGCTWLHSVSIGISGVGNIEKPSPNSLSNVVGGGDVALDVIEPSPV